MIDTGGQPELMEVMPSLIHNADLAIALLNLEYSLSEHQQVDYHERGEGYKRKTPSRLSSRDIILKLVAWQEVPPRAFPPSHCGHTS